MKDSKLKTFSQWY